VKCGTVSQDSALKIMLVLQAPLDLAAGAALGS
jgi:hypothetical protein